MSKAKGDNSFETIERVCVRTFGPNGVAALVQGPTGSMSITRRGWAIFHSLCEENNFKYSATKVLLNGMEKVHKIFGDGVKSFSLMEIAFLRKLMDMKTESMFGATIHQELQYLLQAVCGVDVVSPITVSIGKKEDRVKATSALFCTSCPSTVSSFLQTIFHDWVSLSLDTIQSKKPDENYNSYLQFLFKNFNMLCYRNNASLRSVSDSYVLSGYLVDRVALNLNSSKEEQVHIKLYIPESEVDDLEVLLRIKLIIKERSEEKILRVLLLTTVFLSDAILFELKQHNFIILHGVPKEDAEFISLILLQNTETLNNIVSIKSYINGTKVCLCFLLPNIFQLIMCAPTDSLIYEYTCICKNALKQLLVTARSNCGNGLVKAGGIFEKVLHFHIVKQVNKLGDPSMFLVNNRKELLQWHMQKQLIKFTSSCSVDISNDSAIRKESMKNKIESSEQILSEEKECAPNLQSNECNKFINLYERRVCQVPNRLSTFENTWRNNLEMNCQLFQNINEEILTAFAQSILRISNPLASAHSVREAYEPISFKMQLMQHVIATAIAFLKCDISR